MNWYLHYTVLLMIYIFYFWSLHRLISIVYHIYVYYRSFNFRDLISQCNNRFEYEACDVICDEKSISNGQSRYTGNIGHTRHKTKTIQIHWQHWTHKRQVEEKQNTKTHHRKLKQWATRTSLKTGSELRCSQRVSSDCFLYDTRRVTYI